jgi:hypothetical protein
MFWKRQKNSLPSKDSNTNIALQEKPVSKVIFKRTVHVRRQFFVKFFYIFRKCLRISAAYFPNFFPIFVTTLGGPAIVANAEIAAGEIIGLERPIASYLEKEFVKTNCWNCLVTLKEGLKSTSHRERGQKVH